MSDDALSDFDALTHTRGRGRAAEEAACAWLEGRGWRIVARNVETRAGEIAVVALDDDTLCFVEVKAVRDPAFGPAVARVGPEKRRRLVRAATLWLAASGWDGACRFDVLGLEPGEADWEFELIRGAFER